MNEPRIIHVENNGVSLTVESIGTGRPLLACHGLSGNRHMTQRQFKPIFERYTITTFDQRGHHESTAITDPALYDVHLMVEDIRVVMDAIGAESVVLHGESMGAATAVLFALKYPQRVEALLLTGPAFGDELNPEKENLTLMASELRQHTQEAYAQISVERLQNMGVPADVLGDVIEAVRFMRMSNQNDSLATAVDTIKDWILFDDIKILAGLAMPVCIIAWENDPLHPFALAERMAKVIPDCTLKTIPSVAHVFLNHGTLVGQLYAEFLAERHP